MAVKHKFSCCSECIALASGVFILTGDGTFKKNIEAILSVSNACGVKTAGIDVQAKNIVTAAMYQQENEVEAKVDDDSGDTETPYALSEKVVLDMWRGVKNQAESQIDFLCVNHDAKGKKGALSKWIMVVFEDQVHFSRFENGAKLESYAPVPVSKAAVYAAAIVNGLQPPRDLRQCDKPIG